MYFPRDDARPHVFLPVDIHQMEMIPVGDQGYTMFANEPVTVYIVGQDRIIATYLIPSGAVQVVNLQEPAVDD